MLQRKKKFLIKFLFPPLTQVLMLCQFNLQEREFLQLMSVCLWHQCIHITRLFLLMIHCYFLYFCCHFISLRNAKLLQQKDLLQASKNRMFGASCHRFALCSIYLPHTKHWTFQRPIDGNVRNIKNDEKSFDFSSFFCDLTITVILLLWWDG